MLIGDKILVFQSRCVLSPAFDLPAECAAFQVIDATDIVFIVEPQSVAHQHQVHLLVVLHLDSVDAVDPRQYRCRIPFQVLVQPW